MYHQFALSGPTIDGIDYGDGAPKRKAEGSEIVMRSQKRLHFTAPSAMETLPMDILLVLTDYMNTKDMIHLLEGSTFLHGLRPQRVLYRQALGIENVGSKVLDKAYFDHELTVRASQLKTFSEMLKNDTSLKSLKVQNSDIDGNSEIDGIKALSEALKVNTSLKEIHLWDIGIGVEGASVEGAKAIAEALKVNTSLTKIMLGYNHIGDEGAIAIAEALKVNRTLEEIDLFNNEIDYNHRRLIKEALIRNKEIIKNNKIF